MTMIEIQDESVTTENQETVEPGEWSDDNTDKLERGDLGEADEDWEDGEWGEEAEDDAAGSIFSRLTEDRSRMVMALSIVLAVIILSTAYYSFVLNDDEETKITIIDYDWERAYQDGEELVSNGPRLAGTMGEYQGADYIASQFELANLSNVHIESYTVTLYEVESASLNIRALSNEKGVIDRNYQHMYKFVVLGYSGSTSGTDSFEVAFVGNGTDDAYSQAGDVSGKAVLVKTDGTLSYTQLYCQAMNHSAGANMIYGGRIMPISKTSALKDEVNGGAKPITDEYNQNQLIPHMMLSMGAGKEIKSWSENSTGPTEYCEININFDVTIEDRETRVVMGEIPGTGDTDEFLVMGAHHDTVYCGEGGADNTVGAAGIIETARQLVKYQPKRTIRMMTFGAEEEGLFGSKLYVLNHSREIEDNCIFMTNFDMTCMNVTSDGRNNTLPLNANTETRKDEILKVADEFWKQNPELDEKYNISVGTMKNYPYSDFFHFGDHGSDFAACWGQNAPGYHTPGDELQYTNPESWQIAGRVLGSYTLWLANK